MKFISFENQQDGRKVLIQSDRITRVEVKKHDNPANDNLILFVNEVENGTVHIYEVKDFDYDRFVSFLKKSESNTETFKINVIK